MRYDYLVVGSGLFGSVFAHEAHKTGKSVLVLEKKDHIGGNVYTEKISGIQVHKYGAHIFHTNNKEVWDYINQFGEFNDYRHKVIANYKGEYYDLPFNMNTFKQMWGVKNAEEAKQIIKIQSATIKKEPINLEEQCISMVGTDIYERLVKGYTEKQWGRKCKDLPISIIKRLPLRFEYNSDYFDDCYQGVPINGYTNIIRKMLNGIEVKLNCDFLKHRNDIDYNKLVYTGPIDALFDYRYGRLDYRSLRFEIELLNMDDFQHCSVINYTDYNTPYTRIIEHKHFEKNEKKMTIITREYPVNWEEGLEPYYPINDQKNDILYERYKSLANGDKKLIIGGRLGNYKYYDMDETIEESLRSWNKCK